MGLIDWLGHLPAPIATMAALFASFVGIGEAADRLISEGARNSSAGYISSGRLGSHIQILPTATRALFDRTFGNKHLSWKCARRSIEFSAATMLTIMVLFALHQPGFRYAVGNAISTKGGYFGSVRFFGSVGLLFMWVPVALFADYIALLRSRFVISWLSPQRQLGIPSLVAVFFADIVAAYLSIGLVLLVAVYGAAVAELLAQNQPEQLLRLLHHFFEDVFDPLWPARSDHFLLSYFLHDRGWTSLVIWALIYSSFVPSLWLWAFAVTGIIERVASRSTALWGLTGRVLPIETNPYRSLGTAAAGLCSIGYLVLIGLIAWIR
jgi:hypothetical protein